MLSETTTIVYMIGKNVQNNYDFYRFQYDVGGRFYDVVRSRC